MHPGWNRKCYSEHLIKIEYSKTNLIKNSKVQVPHDTNVGSFFHMLRNSSFFPKENYAGSLRVVGELGCWSFFQWLNFRYQRDHEAMKSVSLRIKQKICAQLITCHCHCYLFVNYSYDLTIPNFGAKKPHPEIHPTKTRRRKKAPCESVVISLSSEPSIASTETVPASIKKSS